ncbi:hypothetical protein [Mucilaginibacter myungsuensis]|uniref:Uncharacterized protein n=1 Tax=Mucilaginibacter myungsuensis TaxID=649104 RepID=A0A929L582_9SPHI|nr:hypothetical protein [Mucilaginibacter myungsuensis]MBE9664230.1 hypothetical protein [Mucilaginibacter myungsuensis]MDN3599934.1 hypothetical protein [Mucilaginibacter myungsuensis]
MRGVVVILLMMVAPVFVKAQTKGLVYYVDSVKADLAAVEAIPAGQVEETINLGYPNTKSFAVGDSDVMLVFTHKFAVTTYKKRIGAFSPDYVNYLSANKNSDKQISYSIDGKPVAKDRGEALTLFHIKSENIRSVMFEMGDGKKASVNIITKK